MGSSKIFFLMKEYNAGLQQQTIGIQSNSKYSNNSSDKLDLVQSSTKV